MWISYAVFCPHLCARAKLAWIREMSFRALSLIFLSPCWHLCMYVGYHDANIVSNFGGDPVTQLNFKKNIYSIILFVRKHVAILLRTWWMTDYETFMYVGYHDANNVSNFGGDPVTQLNGKKLQYYVGRLKTCCHIARHVMNGWLWNCASTVCRVPWRQQCVNFWWWPSDRIKFTNA